ncbi:MAG: DUF2608 domain-containing protein [Asticcacaulis sp.]
MRPTRLAALTAAFTLLTATAPLALERPPLPPEGFYTTADLKTAADLALADHADKKRVLFVVDIDDTILTMPQDLGSEAWLSDRMNIIKAATPEGQSPNYEPLFFEQGLWYQVTNMVPTQADGPAVLASVQAAGIPVYALTARDPNLRGQTERALTRAGYDLAVAPDCSKPLCTRRGRLRDAEIGSALAALRLPAAEKPWRDVTVQDGVMMVAGQDKGIMLLLLAASLGKFDAIYFLDDSQRNVDNVVRATKLSKTPIYAYRYTGVLPKVEALHNDKTRLGAAEAISESARAVMCLQVRSDLCELKVSASPEQK